MYNNKMNKKAQFSWNTPTEKLLRENDKDHGQPIRDNSGITDWQLQQSGHKELDSTKPFEGQLDRTGSGDNITEKSLDSNPKVYNSKRLSKAWDSKVGVTERLDEAEWQKKIKAWNAEQKGQDFDTSFWDDFVGDQMQGEITKITGNVQKSQLQNHKDRFEGLDLSMPINEEYQKDLSVEDKTDNFYKMVSASLKRADSMLFSIYASAAYEDRGLSKDESQMITDINSGKIRLLASMDGKVNSKNAESILKSAQFYDDGYDEPYYDELNEMETNEVYRDMALERDEAYQEDEESSPHITIEPLGDGQYDVFEHGEYDRNSVLEGMPKKNHLAIFNSVEEAVRAFPNAEVLGHRTRYDNKMPDIDPHPELTQDAGERWDDDY